MEKQKEVSIPSKQLEEIKELTKDQQVGMVSIFLNQQIQARLTNEIIYRIAVDAFNQSRNKSKTDRENALNGMTKTKRWLEENDRNINIHRRLIEELKSGKLKI